MRNMSDKRIVAILLNITLKDIFGNAVCGMNGNEEDNFQYIYQDISFDKKRTFGNKIPIKLPPMARKADVTVEKAVFENGTVWESKKEGFVTLQKQGGIEEPKFLIESNPAINKSNCFYYYLENDTCWQCTCGQPNAVDARYCSNCGLDKWISREYLTRERLEEQYQKYLEERKNIEIEERSKELNLDKARTYDYNNSVKGGF